MNEGRERRAQPQAYHPPHGSGSWNFEDIFISLYALLDPSRTIRMHPVTSRLSRHSGFQRSHPPQSDQSSPEVHHPPKHSRLRDNRSKIFDEGITFSTVPQDIESSSLSEVEPGSLTRVDDVIRYVGDNVPYGRNDPHPTPWMRPCTPSEISQGPSPYSHFRVEFQEHMDGTFGVPNFDPWNIAWNSTYYMRMVHSSVRRVCSPLSWRRNLVLRLK